jgi:hypothetical protein
MAMVMKVSYFYFENLMSRAHVLALKLQVINVRYIYIDNIMPGPSFINIHNFLMGTNVCVCVCLFVETDLSFHYLSYTKPTLFKFLMDAVVDTEREVMDIFRGASLKMMRRR